MRLVCNSSGLFVEEHTQRFTVMPAKFLTRKDLARLLEVSVDTIGPNERRLGLDLARRDINPRVIRYEAATALRELRLRNQLPSAIKPL